MGLFDFMKKKQLEQQKPSRDFDLSELSTDFPPVVGQEIQQPPSQFSQLPPLEQSLPQISFSQNNAPALDILKTIEIKNPSKSSMTVNMAPLDFSMPASDDHESISEELNKLFLSDNKWKEPDWNTFDPYAEPEIEHPTSTDFGVKSLNTDLPEFDDINNEKRTRSIIPVDVYVKGSDYARVFSELTKITQLLKIIDPKIEQANNTFSKEEILMKDSKEEMEYTYRKLVQIEKRIFTDT